METIVVIASLSALIIAAAMAWLLTGMTDDINNLRGKATDLFVRIDKCITKEYRLERLLYAEKSALENAISECEDRLNRLVQETKDDIEVDLVELSANKADEQSLRNTTLRMDTAFKQIGEIIGYDLVFGVDSDLLREAGDLKNKANGPRFIKSDLRLESEAETAKAKKELIDALEELAKLVEVELNTEKSKPDK